MINLPIQSGSFLSYGKITTINSRSLQKWCHKDQKKLNRGAIPYVEKPPAGQCMINDEIIIDLYYFSQNTVDQIVRKFLLLTIIEVGFAANPL